MANLQFTVDAETRAATAKLGAFAQDLQKTLTQAIRKLPDLEITADSSDAQKAVAQLRSEMATLANKRIGIDISAEDALQETQRLQNELRQLAGSTTEVQVSADARAAASALGDVEARVRDLNGTEAEVEVTADTAQAESRFEGFKSALLAGAAAAGAAVGVAFTKGMTMALDMKEGQQKLEAQFGLTKEQAQNAGDAAGRVFATGLVDNMADARAGVEAVGRSIVDLGTASTEDIDRLAQKALLLADTFGVEVVDAANAAQRMISSGLAPDADAAFDMIARGFQEGANFSDDFLETIQEYSPVFSRLGLDGTAAFGMLGQAQKAGLRDTDTWADALKEFTLLTVEAGGTGSEAMAELGFNVDQMQQAFGKGGESAKVAMSQIVQALMSIKDPIKQNELGVKLFGTMWEDTVRDILPSFDPLKAGLTGVAGTMDRVNESTTTSTQKIQAMKNQFDLWLASLVNVEGPVGDVAAGIAAFGPAALAAAGAILPLVVALQMRGVASAVAGASGAVGGLGAAAGGAAAGMGRFAGLGALLFNPITLAIGAAAAITMVWASDQERAAARVAAHKAEVDKLSGTLNQYTGAVTEATKQQTAQEISGRKLADGQTKFTDAMKATGVSFKDYTEAATGNSVALEKVNSQLFQTIAKMPEVQAKYAEMKGELDKGGVSFETFTAAVMGNEQAIRQVAVATQGSELAWGKLGDTLGKTGGAAAELSASLGHYAGTLKEAQDQTQQAAQAGATFNTVLDSIKTGMVGLRDGAAPTQAMSEAFRSLAITSGEAARQLGDAAAATGGVAAGAAQARTSMEGSRAAFIGAAEAAGVTTARANELADTIGLIPLKAETEFILNANTDPATQKVTAAVQMADGSTGTMTLDGNPSMVNGKISQAVTFADGSTGRITIDGRPDPATGKINATVQYGNGQVAQIQVTARDAGANAQIDYLARDRYSTIYVQYGGSRVTAGGGVFGYDGGGIMGFAGGGMQGRQWRKPNSSTGLVNPGYAPGTDSVPTLTSPGEAVLVPELVRRLGARRILAANAEASGGRAPTIAGNLSGIMDGTIKGYAGGGVVAPTKGSKLTVAQAQAGWFQDEDGSFDNIHAPKWDHPGLAAWKKATQAAAIHQASTVTIPNPPAGGGGIGGGGTSGPVAVIDDAVKASIEALRQDVTKTATGRQQLAALGVLAALVQQWGRSNSSDRCEDSRRRSGRGAW